MTERTLSPTILIADDDPDDRLMIRDAFADRCRDCRLCFVEDGEEALRFLENALHKQTADCPLPDLILLDLNMPLKDGRETLRELKANPRFRRIPTVILTTSHSDDDIDDCYDHHANSYIIKPNRYSELLEVVTSLQSYWMDTVNLPPQNPHHE